MKECDKWNSHIKSTLHIIYVSSNNDKHPVTTKYTTYYVCVCVDKGNSHINSKLHIIYVSSNNDRHPVTKNFTTYYVCVCVDICSEFS
jgi:hypothetical protein